MKSSGLSALRDLRLAAIALLAASLSGCASPGPARPPSLYLPQVVADLTAARTGNDIVFHWTTPEKTTDALKIKPPMTAEICRELPARPVACASIAHLPVRPGPSEASAALPADLTAGPATLLTYRVRILNANGHSAGLSAPVFAVAGAAPPPVDQLKVTPVRNGAMIEWQPQPGPFFIDLDRTLVQTAPPKKASTKQPRQLEAPTSAEVHLQAGRQSAGLQSGDPGGTIDPTAQRGETYRYIAQRVAALTLDGHKLEMRSAPSSAIAAVIRDTFPPAMPTGLAAVPGSGSIDLSWEPNTESDLAGYLVYRQLVAADGTLAGTPTRLTSVPVPAPAFSDPTAATGVTYSYRVTAVDAAGNTSPASAEVRESLRKE
jgi:hypothetical protein